MTLFCVFDSEVADVLLKPEVEREENEEEESEETDQPQHSIQSLLGDEEEGEDESDAEQDVSHGPDTSSPPEPSHLEEEDSDSQPLPSSKLSSSASSLDSPRWIEMVSFWFSSPRSVAWFVSSYLLISASRATPEPPSGLTDTSMASSAAESKDVSDSASESEEDGLQNHGEEENSFLQEVLSSLKTPLVSASLDMKTEGAVLEMKEEEVKEKEEEEVEMEEEEEVKEEEEEVDESLSSQAAPSCSMLSDQTTKEEEQVVTSLWQEEEEGGVDAEEETEEEEEEEEPAVERFIRSDVWIFGYLTF